MKLKKQLKRHGNATTHRPEVVLNNFKTRLGHTVGRMLGSLFHFNPQFRGRNVVTFHNQRDFIFFRYNGYCSLIPLTRYHSRVTPHVSPLTRYPSRVSLTRYHSRVSLFELLLVHSPHVLALTRFPFYVTSEALQMCNPDMTTHALPLTRYPSCVTIVLVTTHVSRVTPHALP